MSTPEGADAPLLSPARQAKREAWSKVKQAANEGGAEDLLDALANYFDVDRAHESHPAVVSCLEACAEHCREASMAYYVSTK